MSKTPEMQKAVTELAEMLFGKPPQDGVVRCVCCHEPVGQFRDSLSRIEYGISGMCQNCQDSVFDAPEE